MKKKSKIAIVDYGVGNLRSLVRAFEHFKSDIHITEDSGDLSESTGIVLPGDGAFAAGMNGLMVRGLKQAVVDFAESKRPILGICLGAQILMSVGYEFGRHRGLGFIEGKVVRFGKINEKIPQIGWNQIEVPPGKNWKNSILDKIKPGANVYFIHSYIIEPADKKNVLSVTTYGGRNFTSSIRKDNIFGCQFHPEKSGNIGLAIIKNFIELCLKD